MPLITFSSPDFKDKTVYAVFGHAPDTLLAIARANRIPLRFECGEGKGSRKNKVRYSVATGPRWRRYAFWQGNSHCLQSVPCQRDPVTPSVLRNYSCASPKCGNCAIRVQPADDQVARAYPLDRKERRVLQALGKLDVSAPPGRHPPGEWHLACRFIPRDEDIVVAYEVA
ncbi:hypothetical protein [Sedimenticola hydrogenitrophicus]|uniref:hypothetical protein n=1 Tax=Sedimenticola hydrogenitrophicus TaxID=2967975 RepID=UPI0023B1EB89|nr:hypothetical protein [Sedimenticola hydrogenitrophicus]